MRAGLGRAVSLAALGLLAACNRAPLPGPDVSARPPPGIDGRYRGTARLVRGDRACPRSGPRVYELNNGTVTLSYSAGGRRRVPLSAPVQGDGHLQATDGEGTLEGQLNGGLLEITIASRQCEHRWTLRQVV